VRKQPEGALEKRKGRILVRRNGGKSGLLGKAVGMQIWSERHEVRGRLSLSWDKYLGHQVAKTVDENNYGWLILNLTDGRLGNWNLRNWILNN